MHKLRITVLIALPLAVALATGLTCWKLLQAPEALLPPRIPPPSVPADALERRYTAPQRGERLGQIEVPRLKLSVAVYEGDDADILGQGAGHIPGTALPGVAGNICIAAHRDRFFRALRFIQPHDEIVLETKEGSLRYFVNSTAIVSPRDVQALLPAPHRDLTLVTCYPFFHVGPAPRRFIVHAAREETGG